MLFVAACKPGLGEHCQLTRDCPAGLTCVVATDHWLCPDANPMCPACLPGGTCQAPDDDERRCKSDSECAPGHYCVKSSSCAEEGAFTCSGHPLDLSPPEDLAEDDASVDAGATD